MTDAADSAPTALRSIARIISPLLLSHGLVPLLATRAVVNAGLHHSFPVAPTGLALLLTAFGWWLTRQLVRNRPLSPRFAPILLIAAWMTAAALQTVIVESTTVTHRIAVVVGWCVGFAVVPVVIWSSALRSRRNAVVVIAASSVATVLIFSVTDIRGRSGNGKVLVTLRSPGTTGLPAAAAATDRKTVPSEAVVWPGFRGLHRSGQADLPTTADAAGIDSRIVWRIPVGAGWSSFAATENVCLTQEQLDGKDCVTARSLHNGDLLWATPDTADGFRSGNAGDGPRATPALFRRTRADDSFDLLLVAVHPSGNIVCLNAVDGSQRWESSLDTRTDSANHIHGAAASPLIVRDRVVVCGPGSGGPCLTSLDIETGDVVWSADTEWTASYSSPAFLTPLNSGQIVVHAAPGLVGADPETGRVLWQFEWTNSYRTNASQPVLVDRERGLIFASTGYGQGGVLVDLDRSDSGDWTAAEVWRTTGLRTRFSSVHLFEDTLIGLDEGILACHAVSDGRRLWKRGRFRHGQTLQLGSMLLVISEDGVLHLLQPDANGFRELFQQRVLEHGRCWNHPAVAGNLLLLRDDREALCLRLTQPAADL